MLDIHALCEDIYLSLIRIVREFSLRNLRVTKPASVEHNGNLLDSETPTALSLASASSLDRVTHFVSGKNKYTRAR